MKREDSEKHTKSEFEQHTINILTRTSQALVPFSWHFWAVDEMKQEGTSAFRIHSGKLVTNLRIIHYNKKGKTWN